MALAWLTTRHIDAQLTAMRAAYRDIRVELADELAAPTLGEVLADMEREGVRLLAAQRGARLVVEAMRGRRYVPRL